MNVKAIVGQVGYTLKKYSPEILMTVGIVGTIGSTVMACKATLQCEEILDNHAAKMEKIESCIALTKLGEVNYSEETAKHDKLICTTQTVVDFIKLYGPSVTLMGASIGCILGAHHIMSKRNVALMAAYKLAEEAFNKYRNNVRKELGDAKDAHFMYDTETIDETEEHVDENGKKKKVTVKKEKIMPDADLSGFARVFEEDKADQYGSWTGSTQWCKVHDYNLEFLTRKMERFNDMLTVKGFVTVNDVYDELGFPRTEAGMICGWRYKSERGDGYIDFRPHGIDGNWDFGKDGDPIVLDFNIDGVIFDQNTAKTEMKFVRESRRNAGK